MAFSTKQLNEQLVITKREAARYHVPWILLWGIYGVETTHGANITTSKTGAKGTFQFEPETAKRYNYPYTNEFSNRIFEQQSGAAAHYLSDLYKEHKSWDAAIRAYSGGGYGEKEAIKDAEGLQTKNSPLGPIVEGSPLAKPAEVLDAATAWTKDLASILGFLGNSAGWLRVGKVVGGSALLLIAIAELAKVGSGSSGGGIGKTAKTGLEIAGLGSVVAAKEKFAPEQKKEPEEEETVEESNDKVVEEVQSKAPHQEQYGSFITEG